MTLSEGNESDHEIRAALAGCGLLGEREAARFVPLAGGVSCDVWRVEAAGRAPFVVKRALARLRVATEWLAPVERVVSEVRWLRQVRRIDRRLVPEVIAEVPAADMFAMRYLDDATHKVWKDELFAGQVDPDFAAAVGRDLSRIHSTTAGKPMIAADFRTDALFFALRVDPFLLHAARANTALAPRLEALAARLANTKLALVHGDVSPKNILVGPDGPVFLDAECAVYGDPAFDAAFCLTHLLLKVVAVPGSATDLRRSASAFWAAYRDGIDWEDAAGLAARVGELVAALLLARVDGKSPAPYLSAEDKMVIATRARELIAADAGVQEIFEAFA